jgi:hypothetical protein
MIFTLSPFLGAKRDNFGGKMAGTGNRFAVNKIVSEFLFAVLKNKFPGCSAFNKNRNFVGMSDFIFQFFDRSPEGGQMVNFTINNFTPERSAVENETNHLREGMRADNAG